RPSSLKRLTLLLEWFLRESGSKQTKSAQGTIMFGLTGYYRLFSKVQGIAVQRRRRPRVFRSKVVETV
ncbi:Hypothetical protein FKW44_009910, partial [Caligus rogercresseyi]